MINGSDTDWSGWWWWGLFSLPLQTPAQPIWNYFVRLRPKPESICPHLRDEVSWSLRLLDQNVHSEVTELFKHLRTGKGFWWCWGGGAATDLHCKSIPIMESNDLSRREENHNCLKPVKEQATSWLDLVHCPPVIAAKINTATKTNFHFTPSPRFSWCLAGFKSWNSQELWGQIKWPAQSYFLGFRLNWLVAC